MWRFWSATFLVLGATACTKPNPGSCADSFCEDPARPFCDEDGAVGGTPDRCIAVDCEPLRFETCRSDEALVCNSEGTNYDITVCEFGCDVPAGGCLSCPPGSPDCVPRIVPHFMPTVCDTVSLMADFEIAVSTQIDTANDATCTGGITQQQNGLEVCSIRAPKIAIAGGATLRVVGTRAIALVADGSVMIYGAIDVSAVQGSLSGPGGGTIASGGSGGGAGFATSGGAGTGSTQMPGAAQLDPALGDELVGGAVAIESGGKGIATNGGAGGALLVASCRADVIVAGRIDAGGGGAGGQRKMMQAQTYRELGGGGGSGGYIVLEGMTVTVTGELFANGGGGGAGLQENDAPGMSGTNGAISTLPTPTGGIGANGGGSGGDGGQLGLPSNGRAATSTPNARGGGGGGSAGMIQIFTPTNTPPLTGGASVSPEFRPHRTVETK